MDDLKAYHCHNRLLTYGELQDGMIVWGFFQKTGEDIPVIDGAFQLKKGAGKNFILILGGSQKLYGQEYMSITVGDPNDECVEETSRGTKRLYEATKHQHFSRGPVTLFILLLITLGFEIPDVDAPSHPTEKRAEEVIAIREGLAELAPIFVKVGKSGKLVSAEVDPYLLASVAYFESRWHPRGPDGDCRTMIGGTRICDSFGPMQLSTGSSRWLPHLDRKKWKNPTVKKLREPELNVEAAYDEMAYLKRECGGKPFVWLSSYLPGACRPKGNWEGHRRCALAVALAEKAGVDFECGHDPKNVEGKTRALVRYILKSRVGSIDPTHNKFELDL